MPSNNKFHESVFALSQHTTSSIIYMHSQVAPHACMYASFFISGGYMHIHINDIMHTI